MIEDKRFSDWSPQEQLEISNFFAVLYIKTHQLLDIGVLRKVSRNNAASRMASDMSTSESMSSSSSRPTSSKKTVRFALDEDSHMVETDTLSAKALALVDSSLAQHKRKRGRQRATDKVAEACRDIRAYIPKGNSQNLGRP